MTATRGIHDLPCGRGRDSDRGRPAGRGASGAAPGGPGHLYDALVPEHGRSRDRRVHEHGPPDGQHPQAKSLSAAEGADGR